jgi:predicted transposase/invertase (TIGR01784 family)
MTVHNPHDRFFRDSFSRPEIARNYLEEYLPPELLPLLDLDHLVLQDGSFIDESLREHQSDLLYKTRLAANGRPVYLYFLFEHKSFPDPLVAVQLLRYQLHFWEEQVKRKELLAPIMPLVVYHGEKVWSTPTDFFSLVDAPEVLRPYLLDFRYQLNDFSHLSDEEIRGEIWLRVCLSILRAIYWPGLRHELGPLMNLIFQLITRQTGIEYIHTILYYLTRATERVSREALEQALLEQGAQGEQVMATIAQEYIQQGLQQGLKQGLHQGLELGLEQGLEQGLERSLVRILERRFDQLPADLPDRLSELPAAVLEELIDDALVAADYEAFAERLTAVENQTE